MKSSMIKFCHVPATSTTYSKGIFSAAINNTNQTNNAGGMCH